jgi:hypothetical protein
LGGGVADGDRFGSAPVEGVGAVAGAEGFLAGAERAAGKGEQLRLQVAGDHIDRGAGRRGDTGDERRAAHRTLGGGGVVDLDGVQLGREGGDLPHPGELELGQEPDADAATVRVRGGQVGVAGELVRQILQGGGVADLLYGEDVRAERGDRVGQ